MFAFKFEIVRGLFVLSMIKPTFPIINDGSWVSFVNDFWDWILGPRFGFNMPPKLYKGRTSIADFLHIFLGLDPDKDFLRNLEISPSMP